MSETTKLVDETSATLSQAVQKTEEHFEEVVAPVRKNVIKRFPVIFLLLVSLGFTATISGLEQLLLKINFLQSNPAVMLIIGIALLILTGTLYKKLG